MVFDEPNHAEFFYLRPRDIATYVGSGALDVGITGRDMLLDSGSTATEVATLDFGASTFRFAGPAGKFSVRRRPGRGPGRHELPRVGQELPRRDRDHVKLVTLDGAVESAVRLGVADAVADVVSTGTTLRQQDLEIFGPVILESTAVLISSKDDIDGLPTFHRRLHGVLVARQYVLMDYDLPVALLESASTITPGLESPTVSPLHDTGWVAVRVMIPRAEANTIMDALYELGARAILVSPIHAARI